MDAIVCTFKSAVLDYNCAYCFSPANLARTTLKCAVGYFSAAHKMEAVNICISTKCAVVNIYIEASDINYRVTINAISGNEFYIGNAHIVLCDFKRINIAIAVLIKRN